MVSSRRCRPKLPEGGAVMWCEWMADSDLMLSSPTRGFPAFHVVDGWCTRRPVACDEF